MVNKTKNEQELKNLFKKLKSTLDGGQSLKLVYLPDEERISNGRKLKGEVLNQCILIYVSDLEDAKFRLIHEYYEYLQNKRDQSYLMIINSLNKVIEKLLYQQREVFVNSFTKSLVENGFTNERSK